MISDMSFYEKLGFEKTQHYAFYRRPGTRGNDEALRIGTERLCLRAIRPEDEDSLIALLTDGEVGKTYMVPDLPDEETKSEFFRRLQERSGRPENLLFAVAKEERLIGLIHKVAKEGDRIELGYAILPAEKNRGYASEALQAMIGALFAKGFRVVEAGAFAENAASQRVMEKCGMKRLEKTETVSYRGQDHLCVYYGIKNERP